MNYEKYIDHTLLKADATQEDVKKLCKEAIKYDFYSVCINPCYVKYACKILKGTSVKVCSVIGFPLGANHTKTKLFEIKRAISDGVDEVDVVYNLGKFKERKYNYISKELTKIVSLCNRKVLVKVIIETSYLSKEEILKACEIVYEAGVDFIKTSTGFSKEGARIEDVVLMHTACKDKLKIKASGGIKTLEQLKSFIHAGASRIGTSNGVNIINEEKLGKI